MLDHHQLTNYSLIMSTELTQHLSDTKSTQLKRFTKGVFMALVSDCIICLGVPDNLSTPEVNICINSTIKLYLRIWRFNLIYKKYIRLFYI